MILLFWQGLSITRSSPVHGMWISRVLSRYLIRNYSLVTTNVCFLVSSFLQLIPPLKNGKATGPLLHTPPSRSWILPCRVHMIIVLIIDGFSFSSARWFKIDQWIFFFLLFFVLQESVKVVGEQCYPSAFCNRDVWGSSSLLQKATSWFLLLSYFRNLELSSHMYSHG